MYSFLLKQNSKSSLCLCFTNITVKSLNLTSEYAIEHKIMEITENVWW